MMLCPNCGMTVEQAETCPYCKTALTKTDEKAFRKDYTADLLKTVWFAALSFLLASVSLLIWGETLGGAGVHTLCFAAIALVLGIVQFRNFGKYSRRFHTSSFWRITIVAAKYACASIALMIAVISAVLSFA